MLWLMTYYMTWYDVMTYYMTWYDVMTYYMTWYDVMTYYMTWYDVMTYYMTWYDVMTYYMPCMLWALVLYNWSKSLCADIDFMRGVVFIFHELIRYSMEPHSLMNSNLGFTDCYPVSNYITYMKRCHTQDLMNTGHIRTIYPREFVTFTTLNCWYNLIILCHLLLRIIFGFIKPD